MSPRRSRISIAVLGLLFVPAISSCSTEAKPSTESSDSDQVAATVRSFLLAFNESDGDAVINLLTPNGCKESFGEDCAALRTHPADLFVDQPSVDIRSTSAAEVDGDRASLDVTTRIQGGLHSSRFLLVSTSGEWLINSFEIDAEPPLAPPSHLPVVDAIVREYEFDLDESKLSSGRFALRITNEGSEDHELVIKRVDTAADLKKALDPKADQPPANTTFTPVAASATVGPGATTTLVLADQLPTGHYFIVDELDAADGRNHLAHGMVTEFWVD